MSTPPLGTWPDTPPKAHRLIAVIRLLAEHSERVFWGDHAFERLELRDSRSDIELNTTVALRVLRLGDIDGDIEAGANKGEWKVKVIAPLSHKRGERNVGVVVIVLNAEGLFVKSVEWEDRR